MKQFQFDRGDGAIFIEKNQDVVIGDFELIERKGWGHPDKLADDLAESLSRAYCLKTTEVCGAPLHHNFDKLCLLGGASSVEFGRGDVTRPIKILVNGRASLRFGNTDLQVEKLITECCYKFFKYRLPLLPPEMIAIELNLSTSSSPGSVATGDKGNDRHKWFTPTSVEDLPERKFLHANDTSLGTGYFPLSPAEKAVLALVDELSSPSSCRPSWMGSDVKVMASRVQDTLDIVACVPQIAKFVQSQEEYKRNLLSVREIAEKVLTQHAPGLRSTITLNARDKFDSNELYLTATGSSIESGDEGVVGRGNRVNGLITPFRPMNVEGANGKNPVYHVGKVYNVAANRVAQKIFSETGLPSSVHLVSKTGGSLCHPWKTIIKVAGDCPASVILTIASEVLDTIPTITSEIIKGEIQLS